MGGNVGGIGELRGGGGFGNTSGANTSWSKNDHGGLARTGNGGASQFSETPEFRQAQSWQSSPSVPRSSTSDSKKKKKKKDKKKEKKEKKKKKKKKAPTTSSEEESETESEKESVSDSESDEPVPAERKKSAANVPQSPADRIRTDMTGRRKSVQSEVNKTRPVYYSYFYD